MKAQTLLQQLQSELSQSDIQRPKQLLRQLLAQHMGMNPSLILANPDLDVPKAVCDQLTMDTADLKAGIPAAYIFGQIPFLDWDFAIDSRALIPRPETEALAQMIRQSVPPPKTILDLCCGSGVLGLSLALSFPKSKVVLTDLSFDALALCHKNIHRLGLEDRAWCSAGNLWEAVPPDQPYDLIVANPPYVAREDVVEASVTGHEPHLALFSEDRGMAHLKGILSELDIRLAPGGTAAFECGHYHHKTLLPSLDLNTFRGSFRWVKDPFGVARYLFYDGATFGV